MDTVYASFPLQKPLEHYHPIYTYIFQVVSLPQAPHQKPACTSLPPIHATSPAHLTDDASIKCNYRGITAFSKWNKWTELRMWPIQAFLTSYALGNIREIHVFVFAFIAISDAYSHHESGVHLIRTNQFFWYGCSCGSDDKWNRSCMFSSVICNYPTTQCCQTT